MVHPRMQDCALYKEWHQTSHMSRLGSYTVPLGRRAMRYSLHVTPFQITETRSKVIRFWGA